MTGGVRIEEERDAALTSGAAPRGAASEALLEDMNAMLLTINPAFPMF